MTIKLVLKATLVEQETGKEITNTTSTRKIPDLLTFKSSGFASAFNDMETAIIEARKEVETETVQKILEEISKKKSKSLSADSTRKKDQKQK
jgi:hypothetical protein